MKKVKIRIIFIFKLSDYVNTSFCTQKTHHTILTLFFAEIFPSIQPWNFLYTLCFFGFFVTKSWNLFLQGTSLKTLEIIIYFLGFHCYCCSNIWRACLIILFWRQQLGQRLDTISYDYQSLHHYIRHLL